MEMLATMLVPAFVCAVAFILAVTAIRNGGYLLANEKELAWGLILMVSAGVGLVFTLTASAMGIGAIAKDVRAMLPTPPPWFSNTVPYFASSLAFLLIMRKLDRHFPGDDGVKSMPILVALSISLVAFLFLTMCGLYGVATEMVAIIKS